jgi:hypothetical protein
VLERVGKCGLISVVFIGKFGGSSMILEMKHKESDEGATFQWKSTEINEKHHGKRAKGSKEEI